MKKETLIKFEHLSGKMVFPVFFIAFIIASLYGHNKRVAELKQEAIYRWHVGYQQGWSDGRKPVKIDTVYYVDTVIVDSFLIEDNIGTKLMEISGNNNRTSRPYYRM